MKRRILFVISVFAFWVIVFLILKAIFTLSYSSMMGGISTGQFFAVLFNGLKLDMSTSGYLTAFPLLLAIASICFNLRLLKKTLIGYLAIVSALISLIYIADFAVYPYWGFHIDSSIFLYLKNPKGAMASASFAEIILGIIGFTAITAGIFYLSKKLLASQIEKFGMVKKRVKSLISLVLLGGVIFLAIRGGVTTSTMNVGQVYFSDIMYLNHAAINPHFNMLYSLSKSEQFDKQYQFFDKEKASGIFEDLTHKSPTGSIKLLNTNRPNIILVLLESFSAEAVCDSVVAPNLTKLAKEGINFTNFYANSFRTDRGLVSILSGYPAHPTVALMKYPAKTQTLPSIPKTLIKEGYTSSYYYGGDVNFASMRSYIVGTCATKTIYKDSDFPVKALMTKWGAADEYLFDKVMTNINKGELKEPFITTMLTLSSHEPFDIPEKVLDDPFLNSIHYTDKCIGQFMDQLKASKYWDNTVVIFLADHCMQSFPQGAASNDPRRFHIPMIWAGGAVEEAQEITSYGSQKDLASTLLGQLGINYSDFKFSTNMLSPEEHKYAFYAYNNGFSMIDSTGVVIYDNDANKALKQEGANLEDKAKAFFQMMYIDLGER